MISLTNMQAKIAATQKTFETQKASEAGANLVVDGSGNGKITTDIDDTVVLLADGDDIVTANSNNNKITAESGKNQIYINGNNNYVEGGKDEDYIVSIGEHNDLHGGDGNDMMLSIGNNNKIDGGNGDNYIAFQGNHLYVTDGDGDSMFRTLDFAIMEGKFEQYGDYLENQLETKTIKEGVLLNSQTNTEVIDVSTATNVNDYISKLSDVDKEYIGKIDLTAKNDDGSPKYYIAKGKSDGLYHIYEGSGKSYKAIAGFKDGNRDYDKVASGNGYLNISNGTVVDDGVTTTTKTTKYRETTVNTFGDLQERNLKGLEDITIDAKNGADNIKVNVSKDLTIKGDDVKDTDKAKNIFVVGNIKLGDDYGNITQKTGNVKEYTKDEKSNSGDSKGKVLTDGYSTSSPLIVDFNKDGKVSAKAGIGVDIDGNGYSDGAAVDGDKMLAMSDMNGNGVVDGTEVFGDKTVNPFTGEALNAKNGFEALSMIAQEAEKHTGINCINSNGDVDLRKLQEALKTVNINLGFISDYNNTTLEDLAHVASINVSNYAEQKETGEVQHNQLGSYTDTDGQTHKTDDVWFKLFGKK